LPEGLPPRRDVEISIELQPGAKPRVKPPFRLSKVEQDALHIFVKDLLKKNWIQLSTSPWVSNMFGVPKKDLTTNSFPSKADWLRAGNPEAPIRWVQDFRWLNNMTEIPKIPIPMISQLFDSMYNCKYFSTIDLQKGYHQMCVTPRSRKYTAFYAYPEIYEWLVAPMGLAGMPGTWSRLMRSIFDKYTFVVVYLDDICVFSKNYNEHLKHLRIIFEVLRQNKLYANPVKCTFAAEQIEFLGHIIS